MITHDSPIFHWFDALFPRTCHICAAPLPPDVRCVCRKCRAELPRTNFHRVPDNAMERRFMGRFPFERATGFFFYSRESALSVLIQDFKYRRFPGVARELGRLVASELYTTPFFNGVDIILPVPLHWRKLIRRGYNQSHEIARGISEVTGIPVGDQLYALHHHRTQTSLSQQQRLLNTQGIFAVRHPEQISGKGVLIVDDVCTTGATVSSAAGAVAQAIGSGRLSILTLGVTF